eukprot:8350910-Prorocentrum_lima.AAC.1
MVETVRQVQANQVLAQASGWVSALGGTQAGVYCFTDTQAVTGSSHSRTASTHDAYALATRRILRGR